MAEESNRGSHHSSPTTVTLQTQRKPSAPGQAEALLPQLTVTISSPLVEETEAEKGFGDIATVTWFTRTAATQTHIVLGYNRKKVQLVAWERIFAFKPLSLRQAQLLGFLTSAAFRPGGFLPML